jgi:serine-type D-Ala-D-Ala carboxypeptidase/endopeptidase (penicillin-binding protein 4)
MRRFNPWIILIVVFIIFPSGQNPVVAQRISTTAELQKAINRELSSPLFSRSLVALEISDLDRGRVLIKRNSELLLRPASNVKLFTSAAALLKLPGGFEFKTHTYLRTTKANKTELWIRGGGDPLFSSQDIQKIVESIPAAGAATIDAVYLDQSLFDTLYYGEGWMWDDEWSEYTPFLSPFAIDGNNFSVEIQGSKNTQIRVSPLSQSVRIDYIGGKGKIEAVRKPQSNHIVVSGSVRRGRSVSKKVSMWRSQDIFLERTIVELQQAGLLGSEEIETGFGQVPSEAKLIHTVSRALDDVLAPMNKSSNNLCAELLLKSISAPNAGVSGKGATSEKSIELLEAALRPAGVLAQELELVDGSGISFYNLATASAMGKTLRYMSKHRVFDRFLTSMSQGGVDGTLKRRFKQQTSKNIVFGKTGTIRGVSTLSGYILPKGGKRLAFVIFMQNFSGSHAPYRRVQDRIIELCIRYAKGK